MFSTGLLYGDQGAVCLVLVLVMESDESVNTSFSTPFALKLFGGQ